MSSWKLMLIGMMGSLMIHSAGAQNVASPLDDVAFVIEDTKDEETVQQAIDDFYQATEVNLKVTTLYQEDDMDATIQQRHEQWLQTYPKGISIQLTLKKDTKEYQATTMLVTPLVEALLTEEERSLIIEGTMIPIFRNSPAPNDAYTRGLLVGINALQKLLLEKQADMVPTLPEDIVRIAHIDEEFAAGIDNETLRIDYQIKNDDIDKLKAAKLEVFKRLAKEPCFTTPLEIVENGSFLWDGRLSDQEDDYITYKDSPFTVRITVGEDENFERVAFAEGKATVEEFADEWHNFSAMADRVTVNRVDKKTNEKLTKYQYYKMMRPKLVNKIFFDMDELVKEEYNDNPLKYLSDNIIDAKFLEKKLKVHKNYLPVLQGIEEAMGKPNNDFKKFSQNKNYSMGDIFYIRYLNYSDQISNHSFGMALDVDAKYNPQRFTPTWIFIQIVTGINLLYANLTPEEMQRVNNMYKSAKVNDERVNMIISGLQAIDLYQDKNLYNITNLDRLDKDIDEFFVEYSTLNIEIKKLNLRNLTLDKNGDQVEKDKINYRLKKEIPSEVKQRRKELLSVKNNIINLINLIDNDYEKVFHIKQRALDEEIYLKNYLSIVKNELICLEDSYDQIFNHIPINNSLSDCIQKRANDHYIQFERAQIPYIIKITQSIYKNNGIAFDTEKNKFDLLTEWIEKNRKDLIELSFNGFFRLDPEFVHYFLETKKVRWGGHYNTAIDCMHFELHPNKF